MECYLPYKTHKQKQYIIEKGSYLLKSSCCDINSCDLLISDIQDTKNKCNDLFRSDHKDNLDEKGDILSDSLCPDLAEKQRDIYNKFKTYTKQAGTRKKCKISRKNIKNKKHKKHKKSIKKIYRKYSSNK